MIRATGIIPARYGSSRLEGKPLKDICGKPMIRHVYERASQAKSLERVIVATDDKRIMAAVHAFGGEAVMTAASHRTGSDRVAEAAKPLDCGLIVNIQGDEPLIRPEIIDEITEAAMADNVVLATGAYRLTDNSQFDNPNVVKVVTDLQGNALYFSRSLIPYPRHTNHFEVFEHIGIYAYRKDFLMRYITLEDTPMAMTESLEQLRVLEHGYRIKVVKTRFAYDALSVDTQEDLDRVRAIIKGYKTD